MPFLSTPISRRGVLAMGLAAVPMLRGQQPSETSHWALLSDIHIAENPNDTFRGFHPTANLDAVTKKLQGLQLDGTIINGDLARLKGMPGDYTAVSSLVSAVSGKMPVAYAMGNHDNRGNFLASQLKDAGRVDLAAKHVLVIDIGPARVVVLDSLFGTDVTPGFLGKEQRNWLDTYLTGHADKPTVLFVHHTLDDNDGSLMDADRFLKIAAAQRHVKAVFYGHSHRWSYENLSGLHLVNIPAVGYNFEDSQPVGWTAAVFRKDRVELTLHATGGNMKLDGERRNLTWRG